MTKRRHRRQRPPLGSLAYSWFNQLLPRPYAGWDIYVVHYGGYFKAPAGLTDQDKADAAALDRLLTRLLHNRRPVFTAPGYWSTREPMARMAQTCRITPDEAVNSEFWCLHKSAYLGALLAEHARSGEPLILVASDPVLDAIGRLANLPNPRHSVGRYPVIHFYFDRRRQRLGCITSYALVAPDRSQQSEAAAA